MFRSRYHNSNSEYFTLSPINKSEIDLYRVAFYCTVSRS